MGSTESIPYWGDPTHHPPALSHHTYSQMHVINLTGRRLALYYTEDGRHVLSRHLDPDQTPCTLEYTKMADGIVDWEGYGYPMISRKDKRVVGLPAPAQSTLYVTDHDICAFASLTMGRTDVCMPGEPVYDVNGCVIGHVGLQIP